MYKDLYFHCEHLRADKTVCISQVLLLKTSRNSKKFILWHFEKPLGKTLICFKIAIVIIRHHAKLKCNHLHRS